MTRETTGNVVPPTDNPHTREKLPIRQHAGEPNEDLRAELEKDALTSVRGRWHKRQLRSGTIVALRFAPEPGSRERHLAIVRDTAPTTLTEKAAFETEVRMLQIALGARRWARGDDLFNAEGGIAAAFVSG